MEQMRNTLENIHDYLSATKGKLAGPIATSLPMREGTVMVVVVMEEKTQEAMVPAEALE